MNNYTKDFLEAGYSHSIFHKNEVLESNQCGCFYCLKVFNPGEIVEWIDEDNPKGITALCPFCGIDSVIGDRSGFPVTDKDFLIQMHGLYF